MQTVVIPGWVWVNFVILVAAALFVWLKIEADKKVARRKSARKTVQKKKAVQQKPESNPAAAPLKHAIK